MATAVSGRWPERLRARSLGPANLQALIGQSPLPFLAPVMRLVSHAFRIPQSAFEFRFPSCY
jgi:hypothetical protein